MATRVTLRSGETLWRAVVDGSRVTVRADAATETAFDLSIGVDHQITIGRGDRVTTGTAVRDGDRIWVWTGAELFEFAIDDGRSRRRTSTHAASALSPPMPATVLRVNVTPGARVAEGDILIVLEAMKMELSIRAPHSGVISAIHCREGDLVQPGASLVEFETIVRG